MEGCALPAGAAAAQCALRVQRLLRVTRKCVGHVRVRAQKPLRCGVAHISFSAHADYEQTSGFLDAVRPPHVVLVHGEKTEMMRLKSALEKGAGDLGAQRSVYTPAVMQTVKVRWGGEGGEAGGVRGPQ